jgi:hypothetical protein
VVVKRAPGDTRVSNDLLGTRAVIAVSCEKAACGGDQRGPRVGGVLGSARLRFR